MKIKISDVAYVYAGNNSKSRDYFKSMAGKWLEVDTKCVFDDQYNTESNYRILDSQITEIKDDVRTDPKIAFVAWGGKKPSVKHVDDTDIGSYTLFSLESLGYYRLRNSRKTINFIYFKGLFYVANGIGYKPKKSLDVPVDVNQKLRKIMEELHK